MKKTYRSLIAIILAVTMIFAANSTIAFAASEQCNPVQSITTVLGGIIDGLIKFLGFLTPTPDYKDRVDIILIFKGFEQNCKALFVNSTLLYI